MLSHFILNFPAVLTASYGNGGCLSFCQDMYNRDLKAFVAYVMNYKFLISVLWSCQKVLTSRNWILLSFFWVHFWPFENFLNRRVWKATVRNSELWTCVSTLWVYFQHFYLFPASGQDVWTAQEALQPVWYLQGEQDCGCGVAEGKREQCLTHANAVIAVFSWNPVAVSRALPYLQERWDSLCRQQWAGRWFKVLKVVSEQKQLVFENQHWNTYYRNVISCC